MEARLVDAAARLRASPAVLWPELPRTAPPLSLAMGGGEEGQKFTLLLFFCQGGTRDKLGRNNRRRVVVQPVRRPGALGYGARTPRVAAVLSALASPPPLGPGEGSPLSALPSASAEIPAVRIVGEKPHDARPARNYSAE